MQRSAHHANVHVQALEVAFTGLGRRRHAVGRRAMHPAGDPCHAQMLQGVGKLGGTMFPAHLNVLELAPHHVRQTIEHELNAVPQPAVAVLVEVVPVGGRDALLDPALHAPKHRHSRCRGRKRQLPPAGRRPPNTTAATPCTCHVPPLEERPAACPWPQSRASRLLVACTPRRPRSPRTSSGQGAGTRCGPQAWEAACHRGRTPIRNRPPPHAVLAFPSRK